MDAAEGKCKWGYYSVPGPELGVKMLWDDPRKLGKAQVSSRLYAGRWPPSGVAWSCGGSPGEDSRAQKLSWKCLQVALLVLAGRPCGSHSSGSPLKFPGSSLWNETETARVCLEVCVPSSQGPGQWEFFARSGFYFSLNEIFPGETQACGLC